MPTINGPITFETGKELPKTFKDFISKNGFRLPFKADSFQTDKLRVETKDGISKVLNIKEPERTDYDF